VSEQQRAEPKPSIEPNPVTETHGTSDKLAVEVHHSIRDAITATVKRAPKPDTGLPSSYVQTFDGGPCDPKLKPYTNASRGLFTRPENVLPECQNSTNGRKMVYQLLANNVSEVYATGMTPTKLHGAQMQLSLGWWTGYSNTDFTGKEVDLEISRSCGDKDMQLMQRGGIQVTHGGHVLSVNTVFIDACKPGEKYTIKILRNGEKDALPTHVSLVQMEVDMR